MFLFFFNKEDFLDCKKEKNDIGRNCGDLQYLVQEVGAMAGQSSTVIHDSWDVSVEGGRSHSAWTLQTTHLMLFFGILTNCTQANHHLKNDTHKRGLFWFKVTPIKYFHEVYTDLLFNMLLNYAIVKPSDTL